MRVANIAILLSLSAFASIAVAQDALFDFIPDGGRLLVQRLVDGGMGAAVLADKTSAPRTAADWLPLLASDALPGAAGLEPWERQTLADYLAYAAPLTDVATLPPDGRDMTLSHCQSCHIVTVVITQDRPREAWLGTLGKPSHVEVPLTEAERGQLADYLVVNGGVPIDDVPVELRAGGASY